MSISSTEAHNVVLFIIVIKVYFSVHESCIKLKMFLKCYGSITSFYQHISILVLYMWINILFCSLKYLCQEFFVFFKFDLSAFMFIFATLTIL